MNQVVQPADNGVVIGLEFVNYSTVQFRFEDFTNRWRMFIDNVEVAATADQTGNVLFDFGITNRKLTIDLSNNNLKFFVDDVEQTFFDVSTSNEYNYSLSGSISSIADIKLICNATTSDVKLREVFYTI